MRVDALVVGVVVLLAMAGVSVYGWVTLPSDARIPVHRGPGGWGNWQPKARALITYPVGGAVVFAIVLTATWSAKSGKAGFVIIAPLALLVIFFTEYFAVMAATRKSGRDD